MDHIPSRPQPTNLLSTFNAVIIPTIRTFNITFSFHNTQYYIPLIRFDEYGEDISINNVIEKIND